MPKRIVYTKITPLPSNVPRQLALDMLHAHGEIIELNPLVTGHTPITTPRDAARDEYFAQWYEIEEIITWGFGMKKKIAFKGCFHDMPWGLQTHIYAPMGVDLRNKYQIAGNQPGEPREVRELGVDAPAEGLYLKEDVEITCNIALAGFVKKETKQTLETMIERMTKKAELLDDGVLMAMFENGKLKTHNPNQINPRDRLSASSATDLSPSIGPSSPSSPPSSYGEFTPSQTFTKYSHLPGRMNTTRADRPQTSEMRSPSIIDEHAPVEMEGSTVYAPDEKSRAPYYAASTPQTFTAELADTSTHLQPWQYSKPGFAQGNQASVAGSMYSRESQDSHGQSMIQTAPGAYRTPEDVGKARPVSSSSYSIANPDQISRPSPPYPTNRDLYAQAGLAQQINGLNISGAQPTRAAPVPPAKIASCPMEHCSFQGTSEAIAQHVNRHHFG